MTLHILNKLFKKTFVCPKIASSQRTKIGLIFLTHEKLMFWTYMVFTGKQQVTSFC